MANYSNYYITIDAMFQEYIIFNDNGIVINKPSTKNDMKKQNIKKYDDNNNNINEKNEIIENDKQIFDKKPNKLIEIFGNEIFIK